MPSICFWAVRPVLLSLSLGLEAASLYRLPTLTMKNSSRLEANMPKNFARSSTGTLLSAAWSMTRLLNSNQLYSLLMQMSFMNDFFALSLSDDIK